MNSAITNNIKSAAMSVKNTLLSTPRKISPDSSPSKPMPVEATKAQQRSTASIASESKAVIHQPGTHAPVCTAAAAGVSAHARSQKLVPRRRSTRRVVTGATARPSAAERTSARDLRRIKRRLFLEAVNSDQPAGIKSVRRNNKSSTRYVVSTGKKKNRTGKE